MLEVVFWEESSRGKFVEGELSACKRTICS